MRAGCVYVFAHGVCIWSRVLSVHEENKAIRERGTTLFSSSLSLFQPSRFNEKEREAQGCTLELVIRIVGWNSKTIFQLE